MLHQTDVQQSNAPYSCLSLSISSAVNICMVQKCIEQMLCLSLFTGPLTQAHTSPHGVIVQVWLAVCVRVKPSWFSITFICCLERSSIALHLHVCVTTHWVLNQICQSLRGQSRLMIKPHCRFHCTLLFYLQCRHSVACTVSKVHSPACQFLAR
jgi:hypothetical protein